jgi:predicted extracellular nuclease
MFMNLMHRTRQTVAALALAALAAHAWAVDTPIYTIQGSGNTSPLVGQTVTTTGVVTKLTNNGFFLQDPTGDGDPLTSDGIFVFSSTAPTVTAGQFVRLTGLVAEFNVGSATNPDTLAHRVTELTTITGLAVLGSGFSVTPALVTLPEGVNDELEHYEGMLVTLQGPLTVGQNFFQARYGQLTLSAGGRLETPTNRYRPGPQAQALADENARRRIVLDDGRSIQNPNPTPYLLANGTPRGGDTVASITGVIDYGLATASNTGFGDYKIHPTVAPVFMAAHPRTAAPPGVGGNVKLASFNVLNFFTTFTNGQTAEGQTGQGCTLGASTAAGNCRGADNLAEFIRQRTKIVEALAAVNADAVGLMEIQNNGSVAPQNLVDALNARVGAGTYAVVPDPAGGAGTDAIKVAMIYKPGRLSPAAPPSSDTAAIHNRPPLAQTFAAANGEKFTLIVNHFKSKGSCPAAGDANAAGNTDVGDGQGCWNLQRVQQAQALRSFVAGLQISAGSNDVLLVGDFNAYGQEDPVFDLTGSGYVDQIGRYNTLGYSYVFDGAAGRLDHAITTGPMSPKVAFATHWHINADEAVFYDYNLEFKAPATNCGGLCPPDAYQPDAFKASDHDPVVLGLNLYKTVRGGMVRGTVVGTVGDDILIGGPGANTLTGNGGANVFVYESLRDAGDTITDFVPGTDRLDFGPLLAGLGYTGTDPVADGWVRFVALPRNATSVVVDPDGPGPAAARSMVTLLGVRFTTLSGPRDLKPGAAPVFRPVRGAPLR